MARPTADSLTHVKFELSQKTALASRAANRAMDVATARRELLKLAMLSETERVAEFVGKTITLHATEMFHTYPFVVAARFSRPRRLNISDTFSLFRPHRDELGIRGKLNGVHIFDAQKLNLQQRDDYCHAEDILVPSLHIVDGVLTLENRLAYDHILVPLRSLVGHGFELTD